MRTILTALTRFVCAAAPVICAAAPASGDPAPAKLEVGYTMAFWAIPFGHTEYTGTLGANSYSAKAHFETSGVVGAFWKYNIDASADGAIGPRTISPTLYDSYAKDRNKPMERVKVTFNSDEPVTFADPPYDTTTYPVTAEQKKDAVDPMSGITTILAGVHADATHPCGTGVRVFDGRRRYDVVLNYVKDEPVKLGNGLFEGNAHLCQVHYNQVAGYKPKISGVGQAPPPMFADFADFPAAGSPSGHYVVAVKLWSSLSLGTVTVTLNNLKIDGAPPSSH